MKIAILGFSGSGKSTLAKQLAVQYGIPLLYLDTVNFEENWRIRDREEGKKIVADFMQNENWVIDGNYSEFYQKERLCSADMIIILCYNRFVCIKQAFRRNFEYRGKVRESIGNGCIEKMDPEFFGGLSGNSTQRKEKQNLRLSKQNIRKKHTCLNPEKNLTLSLKLYSGQN